MGYANKIENEENRNRILNQLHGELGIIYNMNGNLTDAERELGIALKIAKEIDDNVRYCKIAFTLVDLLISLIDFEKAATTLEEASLLAQEVGRPQYIAEITIRQSRLLEARSKEKAWEAYRMFKKINHPWGMKEAMEIVVDSST